LHRDTAYRIIADHVRTLTFAIADGAVPSNEGRGYVLRRILRRAVRYGVQTLGAPPGFFAQLVPVLVQDMAAAYPELAEKQAEVVRVVTEEEVAFTALLQRGVKYFNDLVAEMRIHGATVISGEKAFFMYDTLGFPIDLTQIMASEASLAVDLDGFHASMKEQQQRSRVAARHKRLGDRQELALGAEETAHLQRIGVVTTNEAAKYAWDQVLDTRVVGLLGPQGLYRSHDRSETPPAAETVGVVLRDTTFYAEAGGQAADTGRITVTTREGRKIVLDVLDVQVKHHIPLPTLL
jgi:alanyl-tRNA synthetase